MGGFDDYYAPAYYEDTDLSFKIRERGLKVLYQPRSIIVHFEGISHGTDLDTGIKANQRINRVKFEKKWREVLQREHFANGTHELRAREHGSDRRVILVIDHYVPEPDRDAGSRLILGYLRAFLTDGWIVKFWPDNGAYRPGYTEALQDLGVEVLYGPDIRSFEAWIPTNGIELDAVIVSRPDVADKYISRLRLQTKCRIFYLGHDLHFARLNLQASTTGDQVTRQRAAAMEALERSIWRRADLSIYPSDEEAETVRKIEPDAAVACVMPFAFDEFGSIRTVVQGHKILFVAGFGHPPNEDGAVWLIDKMAAADIIHHRGHIEVGQEFQVVQFVREDALHVLPVANPDGISAIGDAQPFQGDRRQFHRVFVHRKTVIILRHVGAEIGDLAMPGFVDGSVQCLQF